MGSQCVVCAVYYKRLNPSGPNLFIDVDPVAFCRDAMHCVSTLRLNDWCCNPLPFDDQFHGLLMMYSEIR